MPQAKVYGIILELHNNLSISTLAILRDELLEAASKAKTKESEEATLANAKKIEQVLFKKMIPIMSRQEAKSALRYVKARLQKAQSSERINSLIFLQQSLEFRINEIDFGQNVGESKKLKIAISLNRELLKEAEDDQELISLLKEETAKLRKKLSLLDHKIDQISGYNYATLMHEASISPNFKGLRKAKRKKILKKIAQQLSDAYHPEQDMKL